MITNPVEFQCAASLALCGLPYRITEQEAVTISNAVVSDDTFCLIQLPVRNQFERKNFLEQMFGKEDQVLDIYYAVAGRWRGNIIEWLVRVPVVHH